MRTNRFFTLVIICLSLSACVSTPNNNLYQGTYIVLERVDQGYSVGQVFVAEDQLDTLPSILKGFSSKKVLLGLEGEPNLGQILEIAPVLSAAGCEMFYLDGNEEPKRLLWGEPK